MLRKDYERIPSIWEVPKSELEQGGMMFLNFTRRRNCWCKKIWIADGGKT